MKISDIKLKNSIFTRLIITFLIALIPVYALGVGIYNWGISTVRREILNSMVSQLSFYLNNVETNLEKTNNLLNESINDIDINYLATIPESFGGFDNYMAILRLQDRLRMIKNSNAYLKNVSAHIPLINRTIESGDIKDSMNNEEYNLGAGKNPLDLLKPFTYFNDRIFINIRYPALYEDNKQKPTFVLSAEISLDSMQKTLMQVNSAGRSLILLNSSGKMVFTYKDDEKLEYMSNQVLRNIPNNAKSGEFSFESNNKTYIAEYVYSKYLNITVVSYMPREKYTDKLQKYQLWFWILSALVGMIIIMFSSSTFKFIYKPLNQLSQSLRDVENGNLEVKITYDKENEFKYIFHRFNSMMNKLNILIKQVYKQEILTQRAQLKQLQAQINPHFLYNSFFNLRILAKIEDYDTIIRFSEQLGEYFKFITRNSADEITLENEIKHARIYTDIQGIRFADRIKVQFDELPPEFKDMMVPRLIIQPIIENSFVHGLENKESGGLLQVKFMSTNEFFTICIEDNGSGLDGAQIDKLNKMFSNMEDEFENTGVININKRLKIRFGTESGLDASASELGGIKITMNIKFISDTQGGE